MIIMRFIIFISLLHTIIAKGPRDIPCHLKWVEISNGDRFPTNAVETQVESLFVTRAMFEDVYFVGTYNKNLSEAYFPFEFENSSMTSLSDFEILLNPHGCELEWIGQSSGNIPTNFSVPVDKEYDSYIGRAGVRDIDYELYWFAGEVSKATGGLTIAVKGEFEEDSQLLHRYEVLISYSVGLTVELTDFWFDTDPFGNGDDFLGVDEIHNNSPATIDQTIKHTKTITEKYTMTTTKTWTSKYTETTKVNLIFFSVKKEKVTTYEHSETETIETTDVTEISVSRNVVVPPYTSIQACSVISMKESVEINYKAKARYSAPGITADEILKLLKQDNIQDGKIDGNDVVIDIEGQFSAAIALDTSFTVSAYDSEGGCNAIKRNIDRKNQQKKLKRIDQNPNCRNNQQWGFSIGLETTRNFITAMSEYLPSFLK